MPWINPVDFLYLLTKPVHLFRRPALAVTTLTVTQPTGRVNQVGQAGLRGWAVAGIIGEKGIIEEMR